MVLLLTLGAIGLFASRADSQNSVERNDGFEVRTYAITGARIIAAPGSEIETGSIVVRDGVILAIGKTADVTPPPDAEIIDGKGLLVYPGFIDSGTSALLDPARVPTPGTGRQIDFSRHALAGTPPDNRKSLTPEFKAEQGIKWDPGQMENRRKQGFVALHTLPSGRIASGQGLLTTTSGVPLREAVLQGTTYPEFQLLAPHQSGYPATLMGAIAHLRQAFLDAERHTEQTVLYAAGTADVPRPAEDAALDALRTVCQRKSKVVFLANSRDEIHRALDFCDEHRLAPIIWGGRDAQRCVDRLAERKAGVFVQVNWGDEPKVETPPAGESLTAPQKDPVRVQQQRQDQWRERVAGLKLLAEKGVPFALCTEGLGDPAQIWKSLRQAVKEGLPRDAALASLTRDAALLLGQDQRMGTLVAGKLAHLTVLSAPFDDEQTKVRYVFVDGIKYEYNKPPEGSAAPAAAPTTPFDTTGAWQVEIDSADGKVAATLELKQSASAISGSFRSPQGEGRVTSGSIKGGEFNLVVAIGVGAQVIELKFAGKAEPAEGGAGKITGNLKSAFGAATTWTAQRKPPADVKPDAKPGAPGGAANPVAISLEEPAKPAEVTAAETYRASQTPPNELEQDRRRRPLTTGGNVLIRNGTVLTGRDAPQENTSILVKEGRIAAVGRDLVAEPGMAVIDATGRFVVPGAIDTHSHIMFADGLAGVNEATLSIVPEVRVRDVLRSDDPAAYRALAGGVTTIRLLHGSANVIGGQDVAVKLKYGEPIEKLVVQSLPPGVKFALGENVKFQSQRFPNTRLGVEATLTRAFVEALEYRRQWMDYRQAQAAAGEKRLLPPRRDLRLEALTEILEAQRRIHCHCYRADEILMVLRSADKFGMKIRSLQHVLEGYKVAPEIAAHGASCSTFSDWWAYKIEAFDATPYNAALLDAAGANVVLKSDDAELMRHFYQEASKMLRYGVSADSALRMVTLNAARELGLDERMGSIEVGKDADLAILSGHPLNAFSRCEQTLIDGEVYFQRDQQPTAMTPALATASGKLQPLAFPDAAMRARRIDFGPPESRRFALVGGIVHPVDTADMSSGTVLIDGEKITAVGATVDVPPGTTLIDVAGLHVYPGLIDAGTVLGLTEIGKAQETHDFHESGQFQPDIRAGIAVNPDSELLPVARAGGITSVLIRPSGGIIAGQASLVKLAGWTVPDMVLEYEAGLQIQWPGGDAQRVERLKEFLAQGRLYVKARDAAVQAKTVAPIADPRFEALAPYLSGAKQLFVEAQSRQEIAEALTFAEKESLKIVITGGTDAWKLAAELKQRNVAVIVGPVMRAPMTEYDPFDATYANPGRLHEAGVQFCFRSNSASGSRNVPFEAATAVAYGLPEDAALRAVTLNAARILKADERLGSLTAGKLANLIITDGSPLQPSTQYKAVFIAGRPHTPESKHTRLYEKYKARLQEMQSSQR